MEPDQEAVTCEKRSFARALESLKEDGSNVLLVGETASRGSLCRRLGGGSGGSPRYRLFVSLCPDGDPGARDGPHTDGDRARRISYAAIAERGDGGADALGRLGTEIVAAIDAVDDRAGGVSAGQLRVCVDSLEAAASVHDAERLFRILHAVTSRIKHAAGMGHVHLGVDPDHELVTLFEPLFDAVVELRAGETGYEQRWHLRDEAASSGWLPVDE